ncbi:hypothetical protein QFX18_13485 [Saccharophagus degradans]|uniref:hypothetical protein n=1 Tax=Saccharophagus degradans TaxID=86304 RepID=UPI002477F940|nr:hypothetical protein [Saccharophagus degradans]WGO97056.1 hypothetical protein QFX18_13485 [Saccharophagus degradans]
MESSSTTPNFSTENKQLSVQPNEVDPKFSLHKAITAALKASAIAKKIRPSQFRHIK